MATAQSWSSAIQAALMPVTPQSSTGGRKGDMAKLKVPNEGEKGQLGSTIQSEQEFSQLYQIFAEEASVTNKKFLIDVPTEIRDNF